MSCKKLKIEKPRMISNAVEKPPKQCTCKCRDIVFPIVTESKAINNKLNKLTKPKLSVPNPIGISNAMAKAIV